MLVCPTWKWNPASDSKHTTKELPENRQYISTRVMSSKRIKEVFSDIEQYASDVDGWVITHNKNDDVLNASEEDRAKLDCYQKADNKEAARELGDLDDFDSDDAEVEKEKKGSGGNKEDENEWNEVMEEKSGAETKIRYYDISITYDLYYNTPRLWLGGNKYDSTPLTNNEIFEDIMSDYINKTVTIEKHPNLGTMQASIHPCKHAEVMHYLVSQANANKVVLTHEQALFIFLKFMNSVLPTLEFDFTTEIPTL